MSARYLRSRLKRQAEEQVAVVLGYASVAFAITKQAVQPGIGHEGSIAWGVGGAATAESRLVSLKRSRSI